MSQSFPARPFAAHHTDKSSKASWHQTEARQRINLVWLIKLRWAAAVGQTLAVIAVNWGLHIALPALPLLGVLALLAGTNVILSCWAKRARHVPTPLVGSVLTLDILLLTALLYFTGGSTNPFNFLYLVHIALAAVTLRARWLALVVTGSVVCFALLFYKHVPLGANGEAGLPPHLHQQGLAVAFALAAVFIVHFVHRVTKAFAAMEEQVAAHRELEWRNERLTSLATLAAGAAHELATPLATIAVVSRELERQLSTSGPVSAVDDAALIRQQVERCRGVLTHMAADAGASAGEGFASISVQTLLSRALDELPPRQREQVIWDGQAPQAQLLLPLRNTSQAVRAVVKNAVEASSADKPVTVTASVVGTLCCIVVRDQGHGMAPQVLAHISEPFFTTKDPGVGMGLGLFLARAVFERLGGDIHYESQLGTGTCVTIRLPVHHPEERSP